MRAAAEFIREQGGIERARVFTHVWLALFGLWSWDRVPALPPEIVLLPSWVPLNIYDFACWARQTIVALSLVIAHRPRAPLPFDLTSCTAREPWRAGARRASARGRWLARLDRVLRAYERRPLRPLRRLALARAERWIVRRQEADGSWGGIQPPWVYSLMALHLRGYPLDHPVMRRGLEGIETFMVEDRRTIRARRRARRAGPRAGAWKRASRRCGTRRWRWSRSATRACPASIRRSCAPREWLLGEEVTVRGDWAVARPELAARRLGVRVRQRQLPRRRRHRRGRARAARMAARPRATRRAGAAHARGAGGRLAALGERDRAGDRAGAALGRGHAELATAAGARSTPRTRARSCASCRSWTSAR